MTTALLLENPSTLADSFYLDNGITVERVMGSLDEDELISALKGVQVLGLRSKTLVTRRVIEESPDLKVIGAYCIGTNQIDKEAASEHGVAVFNAPYSNTRSVVELAMAEIVVLARRLLDRTQRLHQGIWDKSSEHSHEVRGRTLGIIGYGSIGTQLSVLAEAMGMKVIFYDTAEKLALGNAKQMNSMDGVLRNADIVSIHVDGAEANTHLFGDREFSQMRPRSMFINLSRGFVVDVDALKKHLVTGHLAGAAIDVFPTEPKSSGDSFDSPLLGLDNVILTPHIGGSTIEAQEDIARFVSSKVASYIKLGDTYMSVNLPNLSMTPNPDAAYRLCLIHQNVPGVMAKLNKVFAKNDVNVVGQSLSTQGELGYVVTDFVSPLSEAALKHINDLDSTVLLRHLPL